MRSLGCLVLVLVALVACGSDAASSSPSSLPSDPLVQMSIAFEDQPSPMTIKNRLDPVMRATDTYIDSDSYSRAGSVLVSLRQQNGTKEMTILKCMPSRVDDPRLPSLTFGNVAAVCSVDIVEGNFVDR